MKMISICNIRPKSWYSEIFPMTELLLEHLHVNWNNLFDLKVYLITEIIE